MHGKYTAKAILPLTLIMTSVTAKIHFKPYNLDNTRQENHNYIPTSQTVQ